MPSLPSPCLDICKFKLRRGHCIACGMTKGEKRIFEGLRTEAAQKTFLDDLMVRQAQVKSARTWAAEYARKCLRSGIEPPFKLSNG